MHTIKIKGNDQHFENLTMLQRGLYATFLSGQNELDNHPSYYKEYGAGTVTQVIASMLADNVIKPALTKRGHPTRYVINSGAKEDPLMQACLDVYNDVRDPAWVPHRRVTKALERALRSFIKQVGDDAPNIMRRGLEAQKRNWAGGKRVDLMNLLSNDKIIRFGDRPEQTAETTPGNVYRLSISKPHNQLPASNSYAIRVDSRNNGHVEGFVFPEGNPGEGLVLSVPTKALSTKLYSWSEYQQLYT
jgi:hypothetical protein